MIIYFITKYWNEPNQQLKPEKVYPKLFPVIIPGKTKQNEPRTDEMAARVGVETIPEGVR